MPMIPQMSGFACNMVAVMLRAFVASQSAAWSATIFISGCSDRTFSTPFLAKPLAPDVTTPCTIATLRNRSPRVNYDYLLACVRKRDELFHRAWKTHSPSEIEPFHLRTLRLSGR